ncbi:hypothetical protein [Hallerella succinigenes]|uniref:hypothetical protein n=1 Tax=Hallerella succinigenes TaxID=1896222 RepID=UPI000C23361E|nr:hypothetical protein [Hallerella succinigenes]
MLKQNVIPASEPESEQKRLANCGSLFVDGYHVGKDGVVNNTLQNQIASQLNDPDAGLPGIVRQDGEIVSVDKATLLSVLAA